MTMTREELIQWARANPNVAALYAAIRRDNVDHFSIVIDEYRREDVWGAPGISTYMLTEASHLREYTGGVEYFEEVVPKKYGKHYECLYKRGDAEPKKLCSGSGDPGRRPLARAAELSEAEFRAWQVSKALNAGMKEHRTRLERMVAGEVEDVYAMHRLDDEEGCPFELEEDFSVATDSAKGVGISARPEPAPLYYDQGEDEFACDADTERKVRGGA